MKYQFGCDISGNHWIFNDALNILCQCGRIHCCDLRGILHAIITLQDRNDKHSAICMHSNNSVTFFYTLTVQLVVGLRMLNNYIIAIFCTFITRNNSDPLNATSVPLKTFNTYRKVYLRYLNRKLADIFMYLSAFFIALKLQGSKIF